MRYIVENAVIKAGLITDAQDMIPKKVQPLLDEGAKKIGNCTHSHPRYLLKESILF